MDSSDTSNSLKIPLNPTVTHIPIFCNKLQYTQASSDDEKYGTDIFTTPSTEEEVLRLTRKTFSFKAKDTSKEGGYTSKLPNEAFVLVFEQESKYCKILINETKLIFNPCEKQPSSSSWLSSHSKQLTNILQCLENANIYYCLRPSMDGNYIYVIISISNERAENWADDLNIDVQLDTDKSVLLGRNNPNFHLAINTQLMDEELNVMWKGNSYERLSWELWQFIHIAFERTIGDVYLRHPPDQRIINHRLHLRILYDLLTNDQEFGGANFLVDRYINQMDHPLQYCFALHHPSFNDNLDIKEYFRITWKDEWYARVEWMRDYYGEAIAFYFEFLLHYSKWLIIFAVVGSAWMVVQVIEGSIPVFGSSAICLVGIVWATFMIEHWYRKENDLVFQWGMLRYMQNEIPRPTFDGEFSISPSTGNFVETYASKMCYYVKMLFSLSVMLFSIAVVLACVFGIWFARNLFKNSAEYGILIGVINALQIQIMNAIYTRLAYMLNEFEGHRLQQEYYNSLVVKRITFIIVNSFNSLFYIAFYDDRYDAYTDSDDQRLNALRLQLVTLFITAIIIQNTMEIIVPKIITKITERLKARKFSKRHLGHSHEDEENGGVIDSSSLYVNIGGNDNGMETYDPSAHGHKISEADAHDFEHLEPHEDMAGVMGRSAVQIIEEIEYQMELPPSPDILDNTAEIVILHGYIILFIVIFPIMPLLGVINNVFEIRVDFYNFTHSQRPTPLAASGIGVWKVVISLFNTVAIFSNIGLLTFRTQLISDLIGTDEMKWLLIFFFVTTIFLLFVQFCIRFAVADVSDATKEGMARQEICEKHLLINQIKSIAKERHLLKKAISGVSVFKKKPEIVVLQSSRELNGADDEDYMK